MKFTVTIDNVEVQKAVTEYLERKFGDKIVKDVEVKVRSQLRGYGTHEYYSPELEGASALLEDKPPRPAPVPCSSCDSITGCDCWK